MYCAGTVPINREQFRQQQQQSLAPAVKDYCVLETSPVICRGAGDQRDQLEQNNGE